MRRWQVISFAGALAGSALVDATPQLDRGVADRFTAVTRTTMWTQGAAIKLSFSAFHPQGMVKVGPNFFLSAVEVTTSPKKLPAPVEGHAYDTGSGVGHLFKFAADGKLIADIRIGEGAIYHPGGIDYDGTSIWVPVAEYRPDSRSIIYRVDPATMKAARMLTVADHIGGIVHDTEGHALVGLSWGSRRFYTWPIEANGVVGRVVARDVNPSGYIDYQDCHYAGRRRMLCGGVAAYRARPDAAVFQLGGIELIDLTDRRPLWQAPAPLWSPSGRAMTQNPFWMEATATGLRVWFAPDDDASTLFVYDVVVPPGHDGR